MQAVRVIALKCLRAGGPEIHAAPEAPGAPGGDGSGLREGASEVGPAQLGGGRPTAKRPGQAPGIARTPDISTWRRF